MGGLGQFLRRWLGAAAVLLALAGHMAAAMAPAGDAPGDGAGWADIALVCGDGAPAPDGGQPARHHPAAPVPNMLLLGHALAVPLPAGGPALPGPRGGLLGGVHLARAHGALPPPLRLVVQARGPPLGGDESRA